VLTITYSFERANEVICQLEAMQDLVNDDEPLLGWAHTVPMEAADLLRAANDKILELSLVPYSDDDNRLWGEL
jgi:hypothetical protein